MTHSVRRHLLACGLAAAASLPLARAHAQQPAQAPPAAGAAVAPGQDPHNEPFLLGRRLKLSAPMFGQYEVIGVVDSLIGDIVVLDTMLPRTQRGLFDGGPVPVEAFRRVRLKVGDIKEVFVSGGVAHTSATVRYGIIGALIGGTIFGLSGSPQYNPTLKDFTDNFLPGAVIGGLLGAGIGAYNGRERWTLVAGPYYLDSPTVGRPH